MRTDLGQWCDTRAAAGPYEMALFNLLPGKTVQDAVAFVPAENPTGPPPGDAAGGLAAIEPGASGWVTLNLAPGTCFVACFVPDNSGKPHVADVAAGAADQCGCRLGEG